MIVLAVLGVCAVFVLVSFLVISTQATFTPSLIDIWTKDMKPYHRTNRSGIDKGIVITAGRLPLITNAIILIRELKYWKCSLPIELWYNTDAELTLDAKTYIEALGGVTCHDISHYINIKKKFQFKVAAMYLSGFDHILFLDADNNVLCNPEYLFNMCEYQTTGAIFWPDYWPLQKNSKCFSHFPTQSVFNDFAQESGQMLVHRKRYSTQLWQILKILEHNYEHLAPEPFNHGDKDWFHITWSFALQPYYFIPFRVSTVGTIHDKMKGVGMGQHDADGKLIFMHQNHVDWYRRETIYSSLWNHVQTFRTNEPLARNQVEMGTWHMSGDVEVSYLDPSLERLYFGFLQDLRALDWYQI